jgi:hypothetical protein
MVSCWGCDTYNLFLDGEWLWYIYGVFLGEFLIFLVGVKELDLNIYDYLELDLI